MGKIPLGLGYWLLAACWCIAGCKSAATPAPSAGVESATREYRAPANAEDRGLDRSAGGGGSGRRRPHSRSAGASQAGEFDFYLLNLSWSPEFCATHAGSAECAARPGFVVHGLWPQNDDGTYPENCSDAPGPSNPGSLTDLIPTVSLVEHEWTTHGTCSGLAADAYFGLLRKAFGEVKIPAQFTAAHGTQTTAAPNVVLAEFGAANPGFPSASFALSCGNNYLTAVEVCLNKSLQPEACAGVRSCRANVVKITPR